MKINKIILSTVLILLTSFSFAQQQNREDVVFNAMRDEAMRTKTMRMEQLPSPFFINYYVIDNRSLSIYSQYGSIMSIDRNNGSSSVGAELFVGNEQFSSRLDYSGKINQMVATPDNNYLSLRTSLWNISDALYKNSLKEFQVKTGVMQQMTLSPEEQKMADIIPPPAVKSSENTPQMVFDEAKWSEVCNKLSSIFAKYSDLTSTSISYNAAEKTYFIFNSKGLELKQKAHYVNIYASATIQDNSGVIMRDNLSIFASEDGNLPRYEELEKQVDEFAKKMSSLKGVENLTEYYNGPVMFTEGAVTSIMLNNLLGSSGIIATKGLTKTGWSFNALERRVDKKVIDTRFSVKNYTSKKEYNGNNLLGYYDTDAEGIKPAEEMVLIENGILKQMLNGNSETTVNKQATGSSRMNISGKSLVKTVNPGTLHISVSKGSKESAMKKELRKLAKEEGLEYAYIVHNASPSCPEVYRIDVKSGVQTRVGSMKISSVDMAMLRRVAAISNEEKVTNSSVNGVLMSIITPKSIILNDIEIDVNKLNKSAQPLLPSPQKRK